MILDTRSKCFYLIDELFVVRHDLFFEKQVVKMKIRQI